MNQKGSVFILFLWVFILFSLLAISVGFRTRLQAKVQGYETRGFEVYYDFLSALNLARYSIDSDKEPGVDSKNDAWYGIHQTVPGMELFEHFDLAISDEESKIDLNKASAPFLEKFFSVLKTHGIRLETDPEDLAGSILAWRGQVSGRGKPTLGFEQKRAPFESLRELELIQFTSKHDAEILRPFTTVYGQAVGPVMRININTVHSYILEALVFSLAGGDFTKHELFEKIEAFRNGNDANALVSGVKQVFQANDLAPDALIQKLGLDNSSSMLQLVSQLIVFLTVDSQYFSVHVRSHLPQKESFVLDAVIGPRTFRATGIQNTTTQGGMLSQIGKPVLVPLEILDWRTGFDIPLKQVSS